MIQSVQRVLGIVTPQRGIALDELGEFQFLASLLLSPRFPVYWMSICYLLSCILKPHASSDVVNFNGP